MKEEEQKILSDKITKVITENKDSRSELIKKISDLILDIDQDKETDKFYNKMIEKLNNDPYFTAYTCLEIGLALALLISEINPKMKNKKLAHWERYELYRNLDTSDSKVLKYKKSLLREFIDNDIEFKKQYEYLKNRQIEKEKPNARTIKDVESNIEEVRISQRKRESEFLELKEKMNKLEEKLQNLEAERGSFV